MSEISAVAQIVKEIGIPALFFIVLIYLCFKIVPNLVNMWQKNQQEQRVHYNNRQEQYDEQMNVIIKVAEQGNQVIARSNELIALNTEAIKSNTTIHEKVSSALSRDLKALQGLTEDIKSHDKRAENIAVDIAKIAARKE